MVRAPAGVGFLRREAAYIGGIYWIMEKEMEAAVWGSYRGSGTRRRIPLLATAPQHRSLHRSLA